MKGECFSNMQHGVRETLVPNRPGCKCGLCHLPFLRLGFLICKNVNNSFLKVLVESLNEKDTCEASEPDRLDRRVQCQFPILLPQLSCIGLRAQNEEILEGKKICISNNMTCQCVNGTQFYSELYLLLCILGVIFFP